MKKIAIQTLGCRANQLESSIIADKFAEYGWCVVKFSDTADVYVINTCTVTGKSDTTSKYFIRKAKKTNPKAKIVVTGCFAQVSPEEAAGVEGVDLVLGNAEKHDIVEKILQWNNSEKIAVSDIMKEDKFRDKTVFSASGRVRATIKIQDGCNYRCSYCIIPYARGKSRSSSLESITEQVIKLTERGFSEIVLSGIHLGQWGLDLTPKSGLARLLQEIEKIKSLKRYRLSSIDPMEFDDELVNTLVNSEKFCRHLHISLQSGNNKVLRQMRRRYTVEQYSDLINMFTEKIPLINIGSDIIVGFPGETGQEWEDTYKNLEKLPIGYMHIFGYSERKGTPAAEMPGQVPERVKKERGAGLAELAKLKKLAFRKKLIGNDFEIIVENSRDRQTGLLKGMTDNFVSVRIDGPDKYKNRLLKVRINSLEDAAEVLNI